MNAPLSLSQIVVYPIKSGGGISLDACAVTDRGLADDRRFMIVDRDGRFVSQREEPRLALLRPSLEGERLRVQAPGLEDLSLPRAAVDGPRRTVTVWRSTLEVPSVGVVAEEWISSFLGRAAAIVHMPSDVHRRVNPERAKRGEIVSFADGYPFLLANEASLADLNARLASPVPMDRFRPNLVVRGASPWDEDGWRALRVGTVELVVVKPCDRCLITTIDQETSERGNEPLRTLATFRRRGNEVWFGQNLVHRGEGTLRVGDAVTVE